MVTALLPVVPRGEIKWNFKTFRVGRDGKVKVRFRSPVKRTSEEMIKAIEEALAAEHRRTAREDQAAS